MDVTNVKPTYTNAQSWALVFLRVFIGWHLLYEGVVKLWNPGWSAGGYLMDSQGFFEEIFYKMAANPSVLAVVDFFNIWGLILIGLSLILGAFTRWALMGGIVLIGLYYLSHPALIGVKYALPSEGSYLFVNKNLIEIAAMFVLLYFPTSHIVGFDRFLANRKVRPVSTTSGKTIAKETSVGVS
jgi:thiosulfate dehydrogenase [quinone] large subunit